MHRAGLTRIQRRATEEPSTAAASEPVVSRVIGFRGRDGEVPGASVAKTSASPSSTTHRTPASSSPISRLPVRSTTAVACCRANAATASRSMTSRVLTQLTHETGIGAACCQQLVVGAAFHDAALVEDDDLVAVTDRRQAVGDDQAGAAAPAEVGVDLCFGHGVERARRLVEHDQARVRGQGARQLEALALAAGQVATAFAHDGLEAAGRGHHVDQDRRVNGRHARSPPPGRWGPTW